MIQKQAESKPAAVAKAVEETQVIKTTGRVIVNFCVRSSNWNSAVYIIYTTNFVFWTPSII